MDSYWLAYYRFGTTIGAKQTNEIMRRLDIMERISASCGFWYPRDGVCIVSDRFSATHWDETRNAQGMPTRLHHDTEPAISFRDGFSLYYWHGYRIPMSHEWIITDKSRINPDVIDDEPNAELRRIMLEIYGFDKYVDVRGATVIDTDISHGRERRLLSMNVAGKDEIVVMDLLNGSLEPDGTRRRFIIGAVNNPNTRAKPKKVHDAVALSYGMAPSSYREVLRT